MITKQDIEFAHKRIQPFIHRTPVLSSQSINEIAGVELYFKCENFQKIGAFKIRGAMNACLSLAPDKFKNGVATHSSGNHAQAISLAAKQLGIKAYIVMPENAPQVKINAVKGYGAEVTLCKPTLEARETTVAEIVAATGAEFIHPFDNDAVITGQATCVKELLEEKNDLDIVVAPVGGGGLLSGTCLGVDYFAPNVQVYAGEPEGAADAVLSIQSGKVEVAPFINTIADGLLTTLSNRTLAIIQPHIKSILTVSDDEIKQALRIIYERLKIVIEPSCAVPFAAVLKNATIFKGKKVGIILTGGNVDLAKFKDWFQ